MALYQRGRIWYADFYINGQRVQTSTGTPNKREAERFMAKHLVAGDTAKQVRISLEEFGRRYMEYAKANKRSWIRDEQMLKQLNGFYGPALLSDIGALSVESYKRQRMNDVAPATVNREIALLKHMYNLAEAWGFHHGRNPVKGVRFLAENNLKLRTLSEEEEAKLLPCCPLYLRDMVLFALHTGLRSGDLFRLQREDINHHQMARHQVPGSLQGCKSRLAGGRKRGGSHWHYVTVTELRDAGRAHRQTGETECGRITQ